MDEQAAVGSLLGSQATQIGTNEGGREDARVDMRSACELLVPSPAGAVSVCKSFAFGLVSSNVLSGCVAGSLPAFSLLLREAVGGGEHN